MFILRKGATPLANDFEEIYPLSKKLSRFAGEAIKDYNMIRGGDDIMIGLSGGKDSLLLALALASLKKRSPVKFGLRACIIDQSDGSMQTEELMDYMEFLNIPTTIVAHPTYRIMEERGERSPCSLCANMRRGILAHEAMRMGCNTVALGHHKDDAAETVLMNLIYGGRFKCFHPHLYMSRTQIRVIRPLVYIEERSIKIEADRLGLPITSSCCPYGGNTKRDEAKAIIAKLTDSAPELKSNIIHALQNLRMNEVWPEGMLNE